MQIFASTFTSFSPEELSCFIKQLDNDKRAKISYQKLLLKLEDTKTSYPLKALGLRLQVFLQQNSLTPRSLIDKLVETKRASNPACNDEISIKFFSKFIKAKVDKKPEVPEILAIVTQMDIDRDGLIGESDLEAFLGRVNFSKAFKKEPPQNEQPREVKRTIGMFP